MTAGRKPTPTALKLVKGNPGKRALVDVIVKRYIEFTGKNAILESSGKTFDEVKHEKSL